MAQRTLSRLERLIMALEDAQAPTYMLNKARRGDFDGPAGIRTLTAEAERQGLKVIASKARNGDFDYPKPETASQANPQINQAPTPDRLVYEMPSVSADADYPLGDLTEAYVRLKNDYLRDIFSCIFDQVDPLEGEGYDIVEIPSKIQGFIHGAAHSQASHKFEDFCETFNRCLSSGPGCSHDPQDHGAMLRVWEKGLLD